MVMIAVMIVMIMVAVMTMMMMMMMMMIAPRDGGCWRHPESAGNNINFGICLPRRLVWLAGTNMHLCIAHKATPCMAICTLCTHLWHNAHRMLGDGNTPPSPSPSA